jgi:tyrosyl-tRNA synthetase
LGGQIKNLTSSWVRDLQRDWGQLPHVVITMPLLEGFDGVQKMSKSYGNYIGIDEEPDQIYGKIMFISDELMIRYYTLLTDYQASYIEELKQKMADGSSNPRDVKKELARYILKQYYNEQAAMEAQERFEVVHQRKEIPDDLPEYALPQGSRIWIVKIMVDNGLAETGSQARRLIKQGSVSLDGERVQDENLELAIAKEIIIKVGKRKFLKIKPV